MKHWITRMTWSIALAIALTSTTFAQIASDNAGNYEGGWADGSNGGTGFGPWTIIANQDGSTTYAGAFIGDPSSAGISGFGTTAFGLYANPVVGDPSVSASRSFSNALAVGQTFSLQWAVNWDTDSSNRKGFRVFSGGAGGVQLFEASMNGFPGPVEIDTGNGFEATGIAFGTGPMTWKVTMIDETTIQVTSTARDGTTPPVFSTNITVAAAPDAFSLFAGAMTPSDNRQPYYNNFQITEGPEPDTLSVSGTSDILVGQTNTLTITRTGVVGDSLTILNDNSGVLSAPTLATFAADAFTTTIDVVGLTAGAANITAVGNTATSSAFAVSVVSLPPTPTNTYDDATFYPLGWSDGSNGGNGFSAWTFQSQGGQHLISDATTNNASNAASLNTNGVAFGLMGGNGGYQEAVRSFASPLGVGDMFTFSFSFQWDDQNRGFDIRSGGDAVFNLNIATNGYSWTGGNTAPATDYPGIREFGVLVDVSITATETGFDYAMSSAQETNLNTSGSVASGGITGFKFYNSGSPGEGGVLHFNRLTVVPSSTGFLSISGPTNVLDVATPVYTLTRNSATLVGDSVTVGSSDTNVIASPGVVNFEPGELNVTFRADTLSAGTASLLFIATGADPAPLAVSVTAGPDGIYDQGSYYYGDWRDGDNNGKGFGAWAFNHSTGEGGFAGTFIGNPADAGITGMDSSSFGFFANPAGVGANAEVTRSMPALDVGNQLSFVWGLNFDGGADGSNRGFDLFAGETKILNINMGSSAELFITVTNAESGELMLGQYGANSITLTLEHVSAGNLRVTATGRDGVESFDQTYVVPAAPDNFKFYFNGASDSDAQRQMYVNDFAITAGEGPGPEDPAIGGFMLTGGAPTVTIASEAGKNYTLVYTTNLLAITSVNPPVLSEWVAAESQPGTGSPLTLTDTNALTDATRVYGVLIQQDN